MVSFTIPHYPAMTHFILLSNDLWLTKLRSSDYVNALAEFIYGFRFKQKNISYR